MTKEEQGEKLQKKKSEDNEARVRKETLAASSVSWKV